MEEQLKFNFVKFTAWEYDHIAKLWYICLTNKIAKYCLVNKDCGPCAAGCAQIFQGLNNSYILQIYADGSAACATEGTNTYPTVEEAKAGFLKLARDIKFVNYDPHSGW
jgi:hypothetical protein